METVSLAEKNKTVNKSIRDLVVSRGWQRLAILPALAKVRGSGPAEGVVGPAIGHGHAGSAHSDTDSIKLGVD